MSVLQTIYNKLHGKSKTNLKTQKLGKTKEVNLASIQNIEYDMERLKNESDGLWAKSGQIKSLAETLSNQAAEFAQDKLTVVENIDTITSQLDELGIDYPGVVQDSISNLGFFDDNASEIKDMLDDAQVEMNTAISNIKG